MSTAPNNKPSQLSPQLASLNSGVPGTADPSAGAAKKKDISNLVGRALVPFFVPGTESENVSHQQLDDRNFSTNGVALGGREWSNGVWLPPKVNFRFQQWCSLVCACRAHQADPQNVSPSISPARPRASPQRHRKPHNG